MTKTCRCDDGSTHTSRDMREMKKVAGVGSIVLETFAEKDDGPTENDYAKSSITTLKNTYPLKLMVPSHASNNNCSWIYPITFGGGLVGGDEIQMTFHVKKDCAGLVTGQESTKVYHCEDGSQTHQYTKGTVDQGGLLCVLSDPVVCYKNSNFTQTQEFRMSSEGNLVYLDWLIGGRVALDELWLLKSYQNKTDVYIDDKLVYRDNYHLCDTGPVSVKNAMKSMQVIGSCIILGNKMKSIASNLNSTLGRKQSIGERYDTDFVCSVSPLKYTVDEAVVTGLYIRFMASSSTKAYSSVVSYIVNELEQEIGGNPFQDKY
ncbi:uncharacterized protein LOC123527590 [Mercenaria mercenaria]|uniref:uncharacterized protein LOC123527590 n=1 Tax=Mercenaria mercenaria TaxID=6596 RepID=UPI00234EC0FB|nr:uncharacterized protein LOC123527590 [Mercenaria mercenaria]